MSSPISLRIRTNQLAPNGWLAPDGRLYECQPYQHIALADLLVRSRFGNTADNTEHILEKLGWVKLSTQDSMIIWQAHTRGSGMLTTDIADITSKQLEAILDWHHATKTHSFFLEIIESRMRRENYG